jgi:hypothetical protein
MSRDGYLYQVQTFQSLISVCAMTDFTVFLVLRMLTENQHSLLCGWLMFSSAGLSGKCAGINLSQATSSMILQNHRRLPVSISSVKVAALWF